MVFDTTILGSNPSAPAKLMKIISKNTLLSKIRNKLFPFYKSKKIISIFKTLEEDQPKNIKVAMFVGGCVRKYLKDQEIDDIDIATIFSPDELKKKFEKTKVRVLDTGIDHGSVTLLFENAKFELTTLRKDIKTDGRHSEVSFSDNWEEDSERRDFTINAIYMDKNGKIFDPQSGLYDLNNSKVKFIGDPSKRIEEDYLRILRFIRFSLQYNSQIDQSTLNTIKLNLAGIQKLSKERILDELFKILSLSNFDNITNKKELKEIFSLVFPELVNVDRMKKLNQCNKIFNIDKNIILAAILLDKSNNHEYFCHKYKTSNFLKEELKLLAQLLLKYDGRISYLKKHLIKEIYTYDKLIIKKVAILIFIINKKMSLSETIKILDNIDKAIIPEFPYNGKYLMKRGISEGKKIGIILKEIQREWIKKSFFVSENEVTEIIQKNLD